MHWAQKTCKVDSFCFNFHRNKRGPTYDADPTVSIGLRDAAIPTCQTLSCTSHIKHFLWLIEADEKGIAFLSKFTAKKHVLHSTGLYGRSSSPITILHLLTEIYMKDSSNSCTWYFPYLAIWELPLECVCLLGWSRHFNNTGSIRFTMISSPARTHMVEAVWQQSKVPVTYLAAFPRLQGCMGMAWPLIPFRMIISLPLCYHRHQDRLVHRKLLPPPAALQPEAGIFLQNIPARCEVY